MTTNAREPLKLFYCYAHEDKALRDTLDTHLAGMKRQGLLEVWYDRQISPGMLWEHEIDKHLTSAHIILLLVSAPFLASDYCYGIELRKALQRDAAGTARVVPIILRPVDWEDAPFSKLQVLPTDAKPVTRWADRDDAFEDIAKELRRVVKELHVSLMKTKEEWLKEGDTLTNLKRYEHALIAYNHTIRLDPNFAVAYNGQGTALNNLKRYSEAVVAYDKAIQLDSNDASFYRNKGDALFSLKRFEEAIVAFNHSIQLDPNEKIVYFSKALAFQELMQFEEAIVALDQYNQLDPDFFLGYLFKGGMLQKSE